MIELDYPSQRSGRRYLGDPMLLDTSLLQHLKYVSETMDGWDYLSDAAADELLKHCPPPLGPELVALGDVASMLHRNGPPWLVSEISLVEFSRVGGAKGHALRKWFWEWAAYCQGCIEADWYPDIDVERLWFKPDPSIDGQLSFPIGDVGSPLADATVPPFGPFQNAGDRALIRVALRAGIPAILTTDLKTFWRHRRTLYPLGIEVWRPSDLWLTVYGDRAAEAALWRSMIPGTAAARGPGARVELVRP